MTASASSGPDSTTVGRDEGLSQFLDILGATPDIVLTATEDSRVVYLNPAGRRFVGLAADQPLGDLRAETFHPPWALEIVLQEGIPTAMRDGIWQGETAILGLAGHEIPVLQIVIPHFGKDGKVASISTILRDISGRKREEIERMEMANRYDAAIRASGQLLFDWNSFTNDMTYAGDVEHFLGYTMKEMAGGLDRFRELIELDDLPQFDIEIQRVIATRDPFLLDYRIRRKDGVVLNVATKGYFFLDREGRIGRGEPTYGFCGRDGGKLGHRHSPV